jgi:DNA-binding transcriptional regulator LsrR (DeoR family)
VSAWAAVLDDVASRGGTPAQVAMRLGLSTPLVQSVLEHAQRLGVVAVAGSGCTSGCPTGPEISKGCAGCPLSLL